MNKQITKRDMVSFLRKYGYIFVLSVILVAVAVTLLLTLKPQESDNPTNVTPTSFYSPVMNATAAKTYSDSNLQYNTTLKHWESHKAVTFTTPAASDVFAALDGRVKEIYSNYLDGTVIVLEHANNLTTTYGSLDKNVTLKVGDVVARGQVIGKTSATANKEYELGNHLRFEVQENGKKVDPSAYLNLGNK